MEQERRELEGLWQQYRSSGAEGCFINYLRYFVEYRSIAEDSHSDTLLREISAHLRRYYYGIHRLDDRQKRNVSIIVKSLSTLARNTKKVALISSLSVVSALYKLLDIPTLSQQTDRLLRDLILEFIYLLERLFDPYSTWHSLSHKSSNPRQDKEQHKPAKMDGGVIITFISECCDSPNLDYDLKGKLVDLIGCIISGSQENATIIICEIVLDKLCQILMENDLTVLKMPTALRRNIFSCFMLMVHTLHKASPETRHVEISGIVNRCLGAIEALHGDEQGTSSNPELFTPALDAVRDMVSGQQDSEGLKASFRSTNVFKRLLNFVNGFKVSQETVSFPLMKLHKALISCISTFLRHSKDSKAYFVRTAGYDGLLEVLQKCQPDRAILLRILDMAVERGDSNLNDEDDDMIRNPQAIAMLITWLPTITQASEQAWLAKTIQNLVCNSEKNRVICCNNGVILAALKTIEITAQSLHSTKMTGVLMALVERLGALSITAAELTHFISFLQIKTVYSSGAFTKRVLRALKFMIGEQESSRALSYFSLPSDKSVIKVPDDRNSDLIKKGFTFHAWLCVEKSVQPDCRRIIYSFQTSRGGFEAFVGHKGYLQIALTAEDGHFHAIDVPQKTLADGHWHMLDIVHVSGSEWKIAVYIDGILRKQSPLGKMTPGKKLSYAIGGPNDCVNEPQEPQELAPKPGDAKGLLNLVAGFLKRPRGKSMDDVPPVGRDVGDHGTGPQELVGKAVGLHGQMASICLFKRCLDDHKIWLIFGKGANHMESFHDNDLRDLKPELILQFHPKMCKDSRCVDMSRCNKDGSLVEGHTCLCYSITDMIKCIGGFQVIIPLLERVTREKVNEGDRDLFEGDASKENNISAFFQLLGSFVKGSDENEEHLITTNSIPIIGALIQRVDRSLIDEFTLMAIQNLLQDCVKPQSPLYKAILQHILFDFRVWNHADKWEVKVGHAHFLLHIVVMANKDVLTVQEFRTMFGVQYILDSISQFYCRRMSMLIEEDIRAVRTALFDIIKFYVRKNIKREELQAILMFIHSVPDNIVVLEALHMLQTLLLTARNDQVFLKLFEEDGALTMYHIIVNPSPGLRRRRVPLPIKQAVLNLMITLLKTPKVVEPSKKSLRLEDIGMGGLVSQLHPLKQTHDNLCLSLMKIVSEKSSEINYSNALSVLSLSHTATLATKLPLSKMVKEFVLERPQSATEIVKNKGWQESICCLLKKNGQTDDKTESPNFLTLTDAPDEEEPFIYISASGTEEDEVRASTSIYRPPLLSTSSASMDSQHDLPPGFEQDDVDAGQDNFHVCDINCSGCVVQAELQSVVFDIHSKLLWSGLHGSSDEIWKERLKVVYSLRRYRGDLYVNSVEYTRLLLEYLLKECGDVVRDCTPADANATENGLQLLKLVFDFLNQYSADDGCLSQNLLELTVDLLARMTVWHADTHWPDLALVGLHILLVFAQSRSVLLCGIACSRLTHLIQEDEIRSESEVNYIIYTLHNILQSPDVSDTHEGHVCQTLRIILDCHAVMLEVDIYLPRLLQTIRRGEDLNVFVGTEWNSFLDTVVKGRQNHCVRLLRQQEQEILNSWNEVEEGYNTDWHRYLRETGESKLQFRSKITEPLKTRIDTDLRRYGSKITCMAQSLKITLDQWRSRMAFFSGSRGTWAKSSSQRSRHWKMSSHENYSRMRMKLIPYEEFDDHRDASTARDNNEPAPPNMPGALTIEAEYEGEFVGEDEEALLDNTVANGSDGNSLETTNGAEELLLRVDCELVSMMDPIPGRLEITSKNLYFYETSTERMDMDFVWSLNMITHVHYRLRNLQRTALEFFLNDHTNYFLNFTKENRTNVLNTIRRVPGVRFRVFGAPSGPLDQVLKGAGLTTRWVKREISNFDYLMQLNTIAGRTYNDWSQYPVFPWILTDYTSPTLDLEDPNIYRDFTKPAGAMSAHLERELQQRFKEFDDPGGMRPFHHGTHYSSAAGVVTHFLVRMEPFTTKHIHLQNNRFDVADRLFFSVDESFRSVLTSLHDCKELTPDFFCQPEFLVNVNGFDLGRPGGDVVLPAWVEKFPGDGLEQKIQAADDFIYKHRRALESEHVSRNLHSWINLVFGYQQRGEAAQQACNVYHSYTYEGAYDLSKMDREQREVTEKIINEFGQTPMQLIRREKHPQRKSLDECLTAEVRDGRPTSILPYLGKLRAYSVNIHARPEPGSVIVVCIPPSPHKPIIGAGFDNLVTISDQGYIGVHNWNPVDPAITNKFLFGRDPTTDNGAKRLVGPFLPSKGLEAKLIAISPDSELVYTGGYWDNSLRIYSLNAARGVNQIKHIPAHYGVVTCLHMDPTGEHLVTGSADTTCKIWELSKLRESDRPLQCLYGHDDEVTCVVISTEYDMVVSGSKDGTINIHTVRRGLFMQSLSMPKDLADSQLVVREVVLSYVANIIVYTEERGSTSSEVIHCLLRYSINGHFLDRIRLGNLKVSHTISTQLITAQDYLMYGTHEGNLYIYEIHRFKRINKMPLGKPIRCVSLAYTFMTRKHSHILVGLEGTPSMMIVLVREAEPQFRSNIIPGIL